MKDKKRMISVGDSRGLQFIDCDPEDQSPETRKALAETPRQRSKVIQVVFVPDAVGGNLLLLCDDGSLWGEDQKSGWIRIEGPPGTEE